MISKLKQSLMVLFLVLSFSLSITVLDVPVWAVTDTASSTPPTQTKTIEAPAKSTANAKVFKKGKYYYYLDPKTGSTRTKAGFVKCGGKLYYVQEGGKILAGKSLRLGSKIYHASAKGPIFKGVHKWNEKRYYSDPKSGRVITKAKFVKYKKNLYYIQKGGVLASDKSFYVGTKEYRAWPSGKIAVGAYCWSDGMAYYSDPKTGEWIKNEKFVRWNKNLYYIQSNGMLAGNKGFITKHRYPYYADKKCRVRRVTVDTDNDHPVLDVAQNEVGNMTGSKYWRWYFGSRFIDTDRTPWCACFAAWCYNEAGQYGRIYRVKRYGNLGWVPSYTRYANNYGRWVNKEYAKGGDLIVFGSGSRHIGIVERVYKGNIYTIEGNSGPTAAFGSRLPGAVTRKVYKMDNKDIKGVIRP